MDAIAAAAATAANLPEKKRDLDKVRARRMLSSSPYPESAREYSLNYVSCQWRSG